MILTDKLIWEIAPLSNMVAGSKVSNGVKVPSYGMSPAGYDLRADLNSPVLLNYDPTGQSVADDPKSQTFVITPGQWYEAAVDVDQFGNSSVLVDAFRSVKILLFEEFMMPFDLIGLPYGKSTHGVNGWQLIATPAEPGWQGKFTARLFNTNPEPARLPLSGGIMQMIFQQLTGVPDEDYGDRMASSYQYIEVMR